MATYRTRDGRVIEVEDGATPEVLRRLGVARAEVRSPSSERSAPNPERDEIQRRASKSDTGWKKTARIATPILQGLTYNFGDEIIGGVKAATKGVYSAVSKGDASEIGKEYRISKGAVEEVARRYTEDNPILSPVLEVGSSLASPVGAGGKLLTAAGIATKSGKAVKAGQAISNSRPIVKAALTGANASTLNAAGITDAKDWSESLPAAAIVGAGMGAGVGGLASLGGKALDTVRRARPGNAENVATERVGELLSGAKMSPAQAERKLGAINARGGDSMLMDIAPSLSGEAAAVSRRIGVPTANDMIERAGERIAARPGRFANQALTDAKLPDNMKDGLERIDDIATARADQGRVDYAKGGVMDEPLQSTDALQEFISKQPEITRVAFQDAFKRMGNRREDLDLWEIFTPDGTVSYLPNLRTFDYVKRSYDAMIGGALKAGDKDMAGAASAELGLLKQYLAEANPKYQAILDTQRDAFVKQKAVEYGQELWAKVTTEPRQLLKRVNQMDEKELAEWRIGGLDVLVNMDRKANPVGMFMGAQRNPAQRAVMEKLFGGPKELGKFTRYLSREQQAQLTDNVIARGRQSDTSRVNMAANDADGGAAQTIWGALKGWAFGGGPGSLANVATTVRNISAGTPLSNASQDEIAKLLMSKGEGLAKRIGDAATVAERRAARRARQIQNTGKTAGYTTSDSMFGGE